MNTRRWAKAANQARTCGSNLHAAWEPASAAVPIDGLAPCLFGFAVLPDRGEGRRGVIALVPPGRHLLGGEVPPISPSVPATSPQHLVDCTQKRPRGSSEQRLFHAGGWYEHHSERIHPVL